MLTPNEILPYINVALSKTNISLGKKVHEGKVRDTYIIEGKRVLVTTDRQSAFDLNLASVPFKGQVLNRAAEFWFKKTEKIIPNHVIAVPDANCLIAEELEIFPVEFVVRAYMTGSTETSIWVNYQNGVRNFCGHDLPEGIEKNHPLPQVIVTPTTKPETGHDESISREEIISRGLMTAEDFDFVAEKALEIFKLGKEHCAKNELILVDTKYEFGKNKKGEIILADEVHTPDSSRFWDAKSYEERTSKGEEPKSFDKDVLRRWFSDRCDPYNDKVLPEAPKELIAKLSSTYMEAYEKITGEKFLPEISEDANVRMEENLRKYFG
jgi:phosphoribosylaminoimidazole-succinocarboxamide synthase